MMSPLDKICRVIEDNFNTDLYKPRKVLQITHNSSGMTKLIFKEHVTKEMKKRKELEKLIKLWCSKLGNTRDFKHKVQVLIKKEKNANKR